MRMKLKKKTTGSKSVRKLKTPEPQNTRGRDGGNEKFKALSDEYKPEFEPKKILVREFKNSRGGNTKHYLHIKVQRFEDEGLPYVFLQMYQECSNEDGYTGYLKGKSIHFPLEMMYEVLDGLTEVSDTCDKLKIE